MKLVLDIKHNKIKPVYKEKVQSNPVVKSVTEHLNDLYSVSATDTAASVYTPDALKPPIETMEDFYEDTDSREDKAEFNENLLKLDKESAVKKAPSADNEQELQAEYENEEIELGTLTDNEGIEEVSAEDTVTLKELSKMVSVVHIRPVSSGHLSIRKDSKINKSVFAAKGGMTVVYLQINNKDSIIEVSTSICSDKENYSKSMGFKIAFERFVRGHRIYLKIKPDYDIPTQLRDVFSVLV